MSSQRPNTATNNENHRGIVGNTERNHASDLTCVIVQERQRKEEEGKLGAIHALGEPFLKRLPNSPSRNAGKAIVRNNNVNGRNDGGSHTDEPKGRVERGEVDQAGQYTH